MRNPAYLPLMPYFLIAIIVAIVVNSLFPPMIGLMLAVGGVLGYIFAPQAIGNVCKGDVNKIGTGYLAVAWVMAYSVGDIIAPIAPDAAFSWTLFLGHFSVVIGVYILMLAFVWPKVIVRDSGGEG